MAGVEEGEGGLRVEGGVAAPVGGGPGGGERVPVETVAGGGEETASKENVTGTAVASLWAAEQSESGSFLAETGVAVPVGQAVGASAGGMEMRGGGCLAVDEGLVAAVVNGLLDEAEATRGGLK